MAAAIIVGVPAAPFTGAKPIKIEHDKRSLSLLISVLFRVSAKGEGGGGAMVAAAEAAEGRGWIFWNPAGTGWRGRVGFIKHPVQPPLHPPKHPCIHPCFPQKITTTEVQQSINTESI